VVHTRTRAHTTRRYQALATTIADERSGAEAAFHSPPTDPVDISPPPDDFQRGARLLTPLLDDLEWQVEPSRVEPEQDALAIELSLILAPEAREAATVGQAVLEFAFYVVREPVLPFRHSPIEGKALGELLVSRVVALAPPLSVRGPARRWCESTAVPYGPRRHDCRRCGLGVASALERRLHDKVLRWLGVADSFN
jgi:hypothetical protein